VPGRRILVTGLGGFVGQVFAAAAKAHPQGAGIEALPLADEAAAPVDIRDAAAVGEAVARLRPAAVVHLAAIASPRLAAEHPDEAWAVNVMGTFNLAHAVLQHTPDARFIFAGSSEAYGASFARQAEPIREDAALDPLSPYGATKAAADIMLGQMARQRLKAIRFRPFNHTGPRQSPLYVVSSFARQIVRIESGLQPPIMRVGNLSVRRDFLDARDVVRAYLDAALCEEAAPVGQAFNLSTARPIAIGAMLDILRGGARTAISVETDPALVRPNEIETLSGDPSKAADVLGWKAEIPIEETLSLVLDHWREQAARHPESLGA